VYRPKFNNQTSIEKVLSNQLESNDQQVILAEDKVGEVIETSIPDNSTSILTERTAKTARGGGQSPQPGNKKILVSRIEEDPGLVRAGEKPSKNDKVNKDINHLKVELAKGNKNPGIGRKHIDYKIY